MSHYALGLAFSRDTEITCKPVSMEKSIAYFQMIINRNFMVLTYSTRLSSNLLSQGLAGASILQQFHEPAPWRRPVLPTKVSFLLPETRGQ